MGAALASSAMAVTVTAPKDNATWDISEDNTIKWTSVSTDTDTLKIVLVNMNASPSISKVIAANVSTSDGKYTMDADCSSDLDQAYGYQIDLKNAAGGILAQSSQFSIDGVNSTSCSSSASASGSSSATKTGSSASGTAASASSSSTSTGAASSIQINKEFVGLGAMFIGAAALL
ncbi:MAG: hypothetical protein M1834_001658 [Cirrosporium novae-zelandiae]|nr:MAG: hypothetical protein M1834_004175 [Cirrosporium novae-zelandiae]KAI9735642.1 MAG: hypothetical protein M1834_001658 [Cirrosporium novae-zelandiae]